MIGIRRFRVPTGDGAIDARGEADGPVRRYRHRNNRSSTDRTESGAVSPTHCRTERRTVPPCLSFSCGSPPNVTRPASPFNIIMHCGMPDGRVLHITPKCRVVMSTPTTRHPSGRYAQRVMSQLYDDTACKRGASEVPVVVIGFDGLAHDVRTAGTGEEVVVLVGVRGQGGQNRRVHIADLGGGTAPGSPGSSAPCCRCTARTSPHPRSDPTPSYSDRRVLHLVVVQLVEQCRTCTPPSPRAPHRRPPPDPSGTCSRL